MKNRQPVFDFTDENPVITHGKNRYRDILSGRASLTLVQGRLTVHELNVAGVNQSAGFAPGERLLAVNPATNSFLEVRVTFSKSAPDGCFICTPYVRETLGLEDGENAVFTRYVENKYTNVMVQRIDNIRENNLVVSPEDAFGLSAAFDRSPCGLFEVLNAQTGENMIVKREHIIVDPGLPRGSVRFNRKQRLWLGLELPSKLAVTQWKTVCESLESANRAEDLELIKTIYPGDEHLVSEDADYIAKRRAQKLLNDILGTDIRVLPVIESIDNPDRRGVLRRLSDFYVGKSTVSLMCRRPYDPDEGSDIVRMTASNMSLLGIDPMDRVFLRYRKKSVSCRVLELDDKDAFLTTNIPVSPELVIGVPAHLRKKLGVTDLSSSIKVDRDTGFIFRRSFNEQIVPILLTLFTTQLFADKSKIISALLSIVAIPVVLYFNLSSKRNMRS